MEDEGLQASLKGGHWTGRQKAGSIWMGTRAQTNEKPWRRGRCFADCMRAVLFAPRGELYRSRESEVQSCPVGHTGACRFIPCGERRF